MKKLASVFEKPGHVALIDDEGHRTDIPKALFNHLSRMVRLMSEKRAVVTIPEDESLTSQAAADYLGMSRQHFVDLLENKRIPFHKVGTHRRVRLKDVLVFEKQRDKDRHDTLDRLAKKVEDAGMYDSDYVGG